MTDLVAGLRGVATCSVTDDRTAHAFGSGDVLVYATPAMVALMEQAAVHALADHLSAGQTTVGTKLEITHLAATPVGDTVRAEAVLSSIDGRRLTFEVTAWDSTEKIGEGVHERVIVSRERFVERVNAKGSR